MEHANLAANYQTDVCESMTVADEQVLERAITKLVFLGHQVGVSPDEMIGLLDGGLTVRELLECLVARASEAACE